jgi:hypothetical protein
MWDAPPPPNGGGPRQPKHIIMARISNGINQASGPGGGGGQAGRRTIASSCDEQNAGIASNPDGSLLQAGVAAGAAPAQRARGWGWDGVRGGEMKGLPVGRRTLQAAAAGSCTRATNMSCVALPPSCESGLTCALQSR